MFRRIPHVAFAAFLASGCAMETGEPVGESIAALESTESVDALVRSLAAANGVQPNPRNEQLARENFTPDELDVLDQRVELGRFLFYDHALSGVEQTSCATCHHAGFQYADGRNIARGVFCEMNEDFTQIFCDVAPEPGVDGNVVGPARTSPLNNRNTPSVFNSSLFPAQMWNGRFHFVDQSSTDVNELDPALGFQFPDPEGILYQRSLLTAQAHIPVTEAVEMTGDFPDFGMAFRSRDVLNPLIRDEIAARISAIPAYRPLFEDAYGPGTELFAGDPVVAPGDPIPYLAIGDAMAHFQEQLLTATNAPFDRYLAGDDSAISDAAKRGAVVFFDRGNCANCHSGSLFSDFANHNIGVPQVGPGTFQSDEDDPLFAGYGTWDFGLEEISGDRDDRFKFRTPPLRGVALTAPYMHNGAYATLEAAIRHHVNPRAAYATYDDSQIEEDMQAFGVKPLAAVFDHGANPVVVGPGTANSIPWLSDAEIADLVAFLVSLTDPQMRAAEALAPAAVPSGLPVDVVGPRAFPVYE